MPGLSGEHRMQTTEAEAALQNLHRHLPLMASQVLTDVASIPEEMHSNFWPDCPRALSRKLAFVTGLKRLQPLARCQSPR